MVITRINLGILELELHTRTCTQDFVYNMFQDMFIIFLQFWLRRCNAGVNI